MTAADDRHDHQLRRDVREQLLASGIPLEHVDQVVELGFHAADRASAVLRSTVFSAGDDRVAITALGIAVSVAQIHLSAMQEAAVSVAEGAGYPIKEFTVGGQADG